MVVYEQQTLSVLASSQATKTASRDRRETLPAFSEYGRRRDAGLQVSAVPSRSSLGLCALTILLHCWFIQVVKETEREAAIQNGLERWGMETGPVKWPSLSKRHLLEGTKMALSPAEGQVVGGHPVSCWDDSIRTTSYAFWRLHAAVKMSFNEALVHQ